MESLATELGQTVEGASLERSEISFWTCGDV